MLQQLQHHADSRAHSRVAAQETEALVIYNSEANTWLVPRQVSGKVPPMRSSTQCAPLALPAGIWCQPCFMSPCSSRSVMTWSADARWGHGRDGLGSSAGVPALHALCMLADCGMRPLKLPRCAGSHRIAHGMMSGTWWCMAACMASSVWMTATSWQSPLVASALLGAS